MAENTWWVALAMVGLAGCVAPKGGARADEDGTSETTDGADPTVDPGPDTSTSVGEDGVESRLTCSDDAELKATAAELATNGRADAAVGLKLLGVLGSAEDNVLLSPLSLRTAFGQVYAGTSGESRTEIGTIFELAELGERTHDVLGAVTQTLESRNTDGTEESPEVIFRPANRSYFDDDYEEAVNPEWMARVQSAYGVCFEFLDLNPEPFSDAPRHHINAWVASRTNDEIPELVKFFPDYTALVLVNALYFRASWDTAFDENLTTDQSFTTRAGASVEVPMMHAPVLAASYAETDAWQAIAIPYDDPRLEMVVILPAPSMAEAFEESLDAAALAGIFAAMVPTNVELSLPKFDITSSWQLKSYLKQLGMIAAFERDDHFQDIAENMFPIFEVFHDVAIAIDEKGTEAAAATGVVFGEEGTGEEPVAEHTMVVDHTFYLAIRDRDAQAVLFFARIGNPAATD